MLRGGEKMKKQIKKIFIVIMVLCLSVTSFVTASSATAIPEEIMPLYNNTSATDCAMKISSSGLMTIDYNIDGKPGVTTRAVVTTYVEKRVLGLFWSRVDIGTTNDEWVDTIYDYEFTKKRTYQLSSSGTYRVNIEMVVYGSGGSADTINYQFKDSY